MSSHSGQYLKVRIRALSLGILLLCFNKATSNLSPQFIEWSLASPLWVAENTTIGTVIGKLTAFDSDSPVLYFDVLGDLAKDIVELKRVGDKQMNITLKDKLDREVVPDYAIMYQVKDEDNEVRKGGYLYILDVNDNPPTFVDLPYRAEIPENTLPGTSVYKVSATDPDLSYSGLVNYNITTQQGMFSINVANGVVTLEGALDYESEKFFQLEVMALDSGPVSLNSTTDLIINIKDVQDTAPFFTNLPYIESVPENATVGTLVLQVSALDGDRGVPNPVNYTFVNDGGSDTSYFSLDPLTGAITVAVPLDREDPLVLAKSGVMEFSILVQEVTDSPVGLTTAVAPVTVRILDINDQKPTFGAAMYTAVVLENTQNRIPVTMEPEGTQLVVTDMDEGANGRFELFLEAQNGQPFNVFEPFPSTVINEANVLLRVKNSSALDFETVHSYTFYIVARETETPEKQSGRATVTVNLEDMNDNWPMFGVLEYQQNIEENSFNNTPVIQVSATDADTGTWGQITYSLRGVSAHLFHMDPTSGWVTVNVDANQDHSLLDREKQEVLFLTAEAQDGGGLRTSVPMEIRLDDRNDNAPTILRDQYNGYINENEMDLSQPVIIEAVDMDQGPNNDQIIYSIIGGNPYRNFTINPDNGSLTLNRFPLDYESMDPALLGRFELTVQARDGGSPSLSSTTRVIINVQDLNDEVPYFVNPPYHAVIPENKTEGDVVTVLALDKDITAPNNEIIYRIEHGARDNFRIAADTGIISIETGADLDREESGVFYGLKVIALDKGTPSLTGRVDVNITITDVNNKRPVFLPSSVNKGISEDKPKGHLLMTFTAVDLDENAQLRYSLLDPVEGFDEDGVVVNDPGYLRSLFGVMPDTGEIYVNSTLDRETVERVTLKVFVEDLMAAVPDPVQTSTGTVFVTLLDVNDNPPIFTPSNVYVASVSESSKPGVEVTRVMAVDPDKQLGQVRYDIVPDSAQSLAFAITDANRYIGAITLQQEVDHELFKFINLTVRATDSQQAALNSTAVVHIEIKDNNDNSPQWEVFNKTVFVWENSTAGTDIAYVYATDVDGGEFGRVMYFLIEGSRGMFAVGNESGVLSVVTELDREQQARYLLTIEARDNNDAPPSEQRRTASNMNIELVDVNDNVPQFNAPSYAGVVQENIQVNTPVAAVSATDADFGNNGLVRYFVNATAGNVSGMFDVNPVSGQVFVSGSLQGRYGQYVMAVVATDLGDEPQMNTTQVYIEVEDVNDHPPVIYHPELNETIYIRENKAVGSFVVKVQASDADAGENGVVQYQLTESSTIEDWKMFHINSTEGDITTAQELDREHQETYTLEVVAYDLGTPRYEDRHTVKIVLLDEDDNPPQFDRETIPVPHVVYVLEELPNAFVANLDLATDPDSGNNSVICYFIVGGTEIYRNHFSINKTSGELRLTSKLDRETIATVALIVKATDICHTHPGMDLKWNISDASLLLTEVVVQDINDNPPAFVKHWFTAGVTKDTQHGAEVLNVKDYSRDPDAGANAEVIFSIKPPFHMSPGLDNRFNKPPFIIGPKDGIIYTDVYFQDDMQGYIEFQIQVNDTAPGHFDSANVSVYLLHQNQRVKVVLLGTTDEVGTFKDIFANFLSNITGAIINVDMIQTHKNDNGDPVTTKTDMFIHGIYPQTGEVMESKVLIELIDSNYASLVDLFKQYNVIEVLPAVTVISSSVEKDLELALIIVGVILGALIIIIIVAFCLWRRKYKRKLKAATAMAYGAHDNGMNKADMPGTNVHAYEGSNPIWLEQYEQGWPKDSDTDSKNSLDENAMVPPQVSTGFDEQEMSMEMYNDEFDHYNKIPNSGPQDADAYLKAALQDHRAGKNRPPPPPRNSNNLNISNNTQPSPSKSNGTANGSVRNVGYDNVGFLQDGVHLNELEATEI